MKKHLLLLISSLLVTPLFVSCGTNKQDTTPKDPETGENSDSNKDDTNNSDSNKDDTNNSDSNKDDTDNNDSNKDDTDNNDSNKDDETEENKKPQIPTNLELKTLAEAENICNTVKKEEGQDFSTEYVKIKGEVLSDFALTSAYHLIFLADKTAVFPILVSSSHQVTDYFWLNYTYEVIGLAGTYKNHNCLFVEKTNVKPGVLEEKVDLDKLSIESSIENVTNKAYTIEVEEKKTNYLNEIHKFSATYISKIDDGLILLFDNEKHIILHGDNKINNKFMLEQEYEFYCLPTVSFGKRAAEYLGSKPLNIANPTAINLMEEKAELQTIQNLYNVDGFNDNKIIYPHVFKVEGYIKAHKTDSKYYLAMVDNLDINPSYANTPAQKRPKAIYAKNHEISPRDYEYSNSVLIDYENQSKKGTFYFVVTNYQTSLHVFQAFVLDELVTRIDPIK